MREDLTTLSPISSASSLCGERIRNYTGLGLMLLSSSWIGLLNLMRVPGELVFNLGFEMSPPKPPPGDDWPPNPPPRDPPPPPPPPPEDDE